MKKGYILVRISIHNSELFKEYPLLSGPTMERFGGKYLIRGGKFEIAEGEWPADRTTVVEFESFEKAKECYESIEYSKAKGIRQKSAKTDLILIENYKVFLKKSLANSSFSLFCFRRIFKLMICSS